MKVAVMLGTFMALLDLSIVNVSLPEIGASFHADTAGLQWVVDAFTLSLSALILSGGVIGDLRGRKRVFLSGIAVFTLASLLCALAPSIGVLIAGRAIQGVGASVIVPGALSLLVHAFPNPAERGKMIGLWGTFGGLAVVVGPLLGGALTAAAGWPWIFAVNIPLGVLVVWCGVIGLTESDDREHASLDPLGQVIAICWLASLTFAMVEAGRLGWGSPLILVLLVVAVLGFIAFIAVELRQEKPMLPIRLFAHPIFASVNLASFLLGFGAYGTYFLFSLFLQQVHGASPLIAGLQFLPYSLAIAVSSNVAGRMIGRFGTRLPLVLGYSLIGVGLLGMVSMDETTPYWWIGTLFAVVGVGMGMAIAPTNAAVLAVVPPQRSGVASATVNACRQTGTALGVAILGLILTSISSRELAATLSGHGGASPDEANAVAASTVAKGGIAHDDGRLAGIAHDGFGAAFSSGMHTGLIIAGGATLVGAGLLLIALRPKKIAAERGEEEMEVAAEGGGAAK